MIADSFGEYLDEWEIHTKVNIYTKEIFNERYKLFKNWRQLPLIPNVIYDYSKMF